MNEFCPIKQYFGCEFLGSVKADSEKKISMYVIPEGNGEWGQKIGSNPAEIKPQTQSDHIGELCGINFAWWCVLREGRKLGFQNPTEVRNWLRNLVAKAFMVCWLSDSLIPRGMAARTTTVWGNWKQDRNGGKIG
jgi:hypothetical protein